MASLKAGFYREANNRYLQVATHVPPFSQDLFVQAWTPYREGYVDHAPVIKNRREGSTELPDYYGFVGQAPTLLQALRAAQVPESRRVEKELNERTRPSVDDIPIEDLLPPCTCGLGLDGGGIHDPRCRVWGAQSSPQDQETKRLGN